MAKTKISEFSSTPGNNTDIDSINIAEGCAPSGINDAIRELMAQLKDFQTGAAGDSFNGPVGTTTAAAGAFTTLTASSTATLNTLVSSGATLTGGTINGMAIGGTTAAAVSATTLTTSSTVTHNGGTPNGVAYLNGSKVLTTGSALTFDGTNFKTTGYAKAGGFTVAAGTLTAFDAASGGLYGYYSSGGVLASYSDNSGTLSPLNFDGSYLAWRPAGSEQMRLTSTGLGIGTSSPANKLVVNVGSAATNGLYIYGTGGSVPTIYLGHDASHGTDATIASNGSTGNLEIAPRSGYDTYIKNGNLGLGVTPSAWGSGYKAIEFGGGGSSLFSGTSVAAQTYLTANAYFNGTSWIYKNTAAAAYYEQLGSSHRWYTAPSGTAGNAISFTQSMTLDASGNLMLGTTTQQGRLHVSVNGVAARFTRTNNTDQYIEITGGDGAGVSTINANYTMALATGGTERARIDSSGNLLVGTTNTTGMVTGFSANQGFVVEGAGTFYNQQNAGPNLYMSKASGYTVGTFQAYYTAGTERGSISYNGSVIVYATTSDYRLKTLVSPVANAGSRIDALNPVEYTWNENNKTDRGFFAHEFQSVYPNSVNGMKDAVDAEGKPVYQSMQASSSEVIADLVAEIQSLRARVAALESN